MSQTEHLCPVCGIGMFVGQALDVSVLGCGQCGGQWLNNAGTQRVVAGIISGQARVFAQQVSARAKPVSGAGSSTGGATGHVERSCPMCQQALETSTVAEVNVEIDACDKHGTWFDARELEKLAKHFEFKAMVADAEAQMESEAFDRATALERRSRRHRGLLGFLLGSR